MKEGYTFHNKPIRKTYGLEKTGTQLSSETETESAKIKSAFTQYVMGMAEFGETKHVVTNQEAQKILKLKNKGELYSIIRKVYRTTSLNDVLEVMGLPFSTKGRQNY